MVRCARLWAGDWCGPGTGVSSMHAWEGHGVALGEGLAGVGVPAQSRVWEAPWTHSLCSRSGQDRSTLGPQNLGARGP